MNKYYANTPVAKIWRHIPCDGVMQCSPTYQHRFCDIGEQNMIRQQQLSTSLLNSLKTSDFSSDVGIPGAQFLQTLHTGQKIRW